MAMDDAALMRELKLIVQRCENMNHNGPPGTNGEREPKPVTSGEISSTPSTASAATISSAVGAVVAAATGGVTVPKIEDGEDNKLIPCEECELKFADVELLQKHVRTHRPHRCNICQATFRRNEHFKRHKLMHTGIRPFACELCDKTFYRKDKLKLHMLNHTGERPHKCQFCDKAFKRGEKLTRHLYVHLKKKRFPGKNGQTFLNMPTLPIKTECTCPCTCGSLKQQQQELHRAATAVLAIHKCRYCPAEFTREDVLNDHVDLYHKHRTLMQL